MEQVGQLIIPQAKKVDKVGKQRKPSVPQVRKFRQLKKFEILHRPFDIKFRGRVNKWLEYVCDVHGVCLENVLDKQQLLIVKKYFYPQKPRGVWLTQKQVLEKLRYKPKKRMRDDLVKALLLLWEKVHKKR